MKVTDEVRLRFLAAPTDIGYSGNVDGGRVLTWIDKAAYAVATAWCGTRCVTAYVGHVKFGRPVRSGELVEVTAKLIHTGRSSMHILVTVDSSDPRVGEPQRATSCLVIFVAVDEQGHSAEVPVWTPATDADVANQQSAIQRIGLRKDIEAAMAAQQYTAAGTAPKALLRFMAAPDVVNWGGNVHGGNVMQWIDEAAHLLATTYTGNAKNVAVYTGGIRFYQPLHIGEVVEVEARLLHTGNTSMHIAVHVRSADPRTLQFRLTTHCLVLFVALDETGHAVEAPKWVPASDEDIALDRHAVDLMQLRAAVGRFAVGDAE